MSAAVLVADVPRGGKPQLPAFCRTRRPTTTVYVSTLRDLYRLLLLVIAGPVPPRLPSVGTSTVFLPAAGGSTPLTPRQQP